MILIAILILFSAGFGDVSFRGDWEHGLTGKSNWQSLQIVDSSRLKIENYNIRQGCYAVRIEVRPGDDPIKSSGERAEVSKMTDSLGNPISEDESSGIKYYAFSFLLDTNWKVPEPDTDGAWAILAQLHGPSLFAAPPAFAVSVFNGLKIQLTSGDLDSSSKRLKSKYYSLSDSSLNMGKWVDVAIRIKYAKDFTGGVTVWRRNQGEQDYRQCLDVQNVPTLQYMSSVSACVGPHYWKHGLYRSKQKTITNILYLDGFVRGDSFDDITKCNCK